MGSRESSINKTTNILLMACVTFDISLQMDVRKDFYFGRLIRDWAGIASLSRRADVILLRRTPTANCT